MSLKTDTNTTDTDKIGAEMFNQENIAYYINRSKQFKQKSRKPYTFVWEFYNKQLQTTIETDADYDAKKQIQSHQDIKFNQDINVRPRMVKVSIHVNN